MAEKKKPTRCEVRCAIWDEMKTYAGYNVNTIFAARRVDKGYGGGWFLIHRASGYSAGCYPTLATARASGDALVKAIGVKAWTFENPDRAPQMKTKWKRAKAIVNSFMTARWER